MVLLHGLFGSGSNLNALARSLSDRYRVISADLPGHGRSEWIERMDLPSLTARVQQGLASHLQGPAAYVGHSLGGKVAMQLALSAPQQPAALVVADIAPVQYPSHHDAVFSALDAVNASPVRSREDAAGRMAPYLHDDSLGQFLLMSLARGGDGSFGWRFDLHTIRRDYAHILAAPAGVGAWPGPTLFVRGGASDYILPEHRHAILSRFPAAAVKVMAGCGHWLHAEHPELFNRIVGRFLDAQFAAAGAA